MFVINHTTLIVYLPYQWWCPNNIIQIMTHNITYNNDFSQWSHQTVVIQAVKCVYIILKSVKIPEVVYMYSLFVIWFVTFFMHWCLTWLSSFKTVIIYSAIILHPHSEIGRHISLDGDSGCMESNDKIIIWLLIEIDKPVQHTF